MVELDENEFEELEGICKDVAGLDSLMDALITGEYTHPDAFRVLGNYLSEVHNHFYRFIEDMRPESEEE